MERDRLVRRARWLAPAIALVLMTACTTRLDVAKLEETIADGISTQSGATGVTVDCPDDVEVEDGGTFDCDVTDDTGATATVTVTQTDDQGNVTWVLN